MRAYERLLQYVVVPTGSDESCETCPSTARQLVLAEKLKEELISLGVSDAHVDQNGYVYATIPSNIDRKVPTIGFIAHMDTVGEIPFEPVKPRIIEQYDGSVIRLNDTLSTDPAEFPVLNNYKGKTLIVTDGNTLLGADDKAGVAEIMTMAERLMTDKTIRHGTVKIGFTPDEEIGRGADLFDVKHFGADYAYTVDGAGFGEVEYETFNAVACEVTVKGRSIHPGEAKDKMKNASIIAMEFNNLLPANERPEHTDRYDGFYHLTDMEGSIEQAHLSYILRDHDGDKIRERQDVVRRAAEYLNAKYGDGTVTVSLKESYRNMAEVIRDHFHLIETAFEAVREIGGKPVSNPVRGGTDGSRLSFMGLPCPNLGTASHLHHGRQEFACAEDMDKCVELCVRIAEKYAQ